MRYPISHKRLYNYPKESASILLEAVLAAVIAMGTLAIIAPMFAKQLELTRRARDIALIEAAVNEDIANIRQYATYYRLRSGGYSSQLINYAITTSPADGPESNVTLYDPTFGFSKFAKPLKCQDEIRMVRDLTTDAPKGYKAVPGSTNTPFSTTNNSVALVNGYTVLRDLRLHPLNSGGTSLRITYSLAPSSQPLSLTRTVDIMPSAQFGC